jgi:hypothetical protein
LKCCRLSVFELVGGPRRDRTGDLLIANGIGDPSEQVEQGLSTSPDDKKPEGETR